MKNRTTQQRGIIKIFYLISLGGLLSGIGLFLFFLGKTDLSPTYHRDSLTLSLKKLCSDEYAVNVTAQMQGDTVWILTPTDTLFIKNTEYSEEALTRIKIILKTLGRIILSMEDPPRYYVIQINETSSLREALIMGMGEDMIQFQYGYFPHEEYSRRRVEEFHSGEKTKAFDLTKEDFLSRLISQEIGKVFEQLSDYFEMKNFTMNYSLSDQEFKVDYDIRPLKETTPLLVFNQIKKRVQETLGNKYGLKDDRSIKFIDRFEKMEKTFSLKELGNA